MNVEELLNNVFFTVEDKDISGTSQRDPLGFQPIWSFYGRQVVNHLTTISTSIHGFREVLLCLSICGEVRETKTNLSYSDLILLFEQLFIYSAISREKTEGIIGADNGKNKFDASKGNPEVSTSQTILVREISLGYYGRYKTPLSTMGIINAKSGLEIDLNYAKELYGKSVYLNIQNAFKEFIESNRMFKRFSAQDYLYEAVFGKFRPNEREFWIDRLYKVGKEEKELMKLCYKNVNPELTAKEIFFSLPREKSEVSNILKLEPFLRCLEEIFYKAMTSKDLKSIEIENLEEHKKRYDDFCSIPDADVSSLFNKRIRFLREKCSPYSEDYKKNVVEYHRSVCAQKNSSVWVESDASGMLQSFVDVDDMNVNIDDWNRDYYLSSLMSVKNEILRFSK